MTIKLATNDKIAEASSEENRENNFIKKILEMRKY